nr:branched-chain amino acid ABC transporter permease [Azospirillum oleiclasticum]
MVLLPLLLLAGCGGVDGEQLALCRRLIPAFEDNPASLRILSAEHDTVDGRSLTIRYEEEGFGHYIVCRFGGRFFDSGRHELEGVETDRTGLLSEMEFLMLRVWARIPPPRGEPLPGGRAVQSGPSPWVPALYFMQQVVNAATVSCVYGLLAIGYTLVYAIVGRINLAMGELTMTGAMMAAMAASGLAMAGAGALPLALLVVLVIAMGFTAVQGWAMDRLLFRHVRGVGTHAPLILAIGLAIAMQEGVRLLHGAREWWPAPVYATTRTLLAVPGFRVTAVTAQGVVVALTLGLYALLWWVMRRTAFGRAHRACTDDAWAAALMGLDVNRTVALTFAIGGACAAAAGTVIALYYGGVNFFTGFLVGFKALTAAVIGGIGSVPGAMLGGLLLGLVETFWSGYFAIAYKDVVAFGLLALFLIYRPHGLLGQARSRGD